MTDIHPPTSIRQFPPPETPTQQPTPETQTTPNSALNSPLRVPTTPHYQRISEQQGGGGGGNANNNSSPISNIFGGNTGGVNMEFPSNADLQTREVNLRKKKAKLVSEFALNKALGRVASLERALEYQKDVHLEQLKGLHAEVKRLQGVCNDLNLQIVINGDFEQDKRGPRTRRMSLSQVTNGLLHQIRISNPTPNPTASTTILETQAQSDSSVRNSLQELENSISEQQHPSKARRASWFNKKDLVKVNFTSTTAEGAAELANQKTPLATKGSHKIGKADILKPEKKQQQKSGGSGGAEKDSKSENDCEDDEDLNIEEEESLSLLLQKQKKKYQTTLERTHIENQKQKKDLEKFKSEVELLKEVLLISTGLKFQPKELKEAVQALQSTKIKLEKTRLSQDKSTISLIPPAEGPTISTKRRLTPKKRHPILPPIKKPDQQNVASDLLERASTPKSNNRLLQDQQIVTSPSPPPSKSNASTSRSAQFRNRHYQLKSSTPGQSYGVKQTSVLVEKQKRNTQKVIEPLLPGKIQSSGVSNSEVEEGEGKTVELISVERQRIASNLISNIANSNFGGVSKKGDEGLTNELNSTLTEYSAQPCLPVGQNLPAGVQAWRKKLQGTSVVRKKMLKDMLQQ